MDQLKHRIVRDGHMRFTLLVFKPFEPFYFHVLLYFEMFALCSASVSAKAFAPVPSFLLHI
jgi:hypothetical protein